MSTSIINQHGKTLAIRFAQGEGKGAAIKICLSDEELGLELCSYQYVVLEGGGMFEGYHVSQMPFAEALDCLKEGGKYPILENEERKFISVEVYKFPLGECTNDGVSSKSRLRLLVEVPDGYILESELGDNDVILVKDSIRTGSDEYVRLTPEDLYNSSKWTMAGGNFAYTSDSRFRRSYGQYPLSIHDRVE
jgi:hypothetical protein